MSLLPVMLFGDPHVPYQDKRAWALFLAVAKVVKPKILVCLGDLADCYSVSGHDKSPDRANRFEWEMDECNRALDQLDAIGADDKIYVLGNHEDRLKRLMMKQPELFGVVTIPKLLKLKERKWECVPYKHHTQRGKITLTHDIGSAGRNSVFKALDLYQHSVFHAHTHRMSYIVEGNALGTGTKVSASFGWLGDVGQIDYMNLATARSAWSLGFGAGCVDTSTGYWYVNPHPILNDYSCVVNGRLFRQPKKAA